MIPEHIVLKLKMNERTFKTCNLSTVQLDDDDVIDLANLIKKNQYIKLVVLKRGLNLLASTISFVNDTCPNVLFHNIMESPNRIRHTENCITNSLPPHNFGLDPRDDRSISYESFLTPAFQNANNAQGSDTDDDPGCDPDDSPVTGFVVHSLA